MFKMVNQDHIVRTLIYKLSSLNFLVVIGESLKIFMWGWGDKEV